jgi:hypothetical protein
MPDFSWFEDPLPDGRVITADDVKSAAQEAAERLSLQIQPGTTATLGVWIGRRFEFTVDATNVQPRVVKVKP